MSNTEVKLTEARQKAAEAQKQIVDAQKVMAESVKTALIEGMTPIFENYPFLGSVHWTQYTPYFNDGEPCVFGANFYPGINSLKDIEEETTSHYSEEHGEDFGAKSDKQTYVGYDHEKRTSKYVDNDAYDSQYEACEKEVNELFKAIQGPSQPYSGYDAPRPFDMALLQAFGDHALVTITRDGIEVDGYDHE